MEDKLPKDFNAERKLFYSVVVGWGLILFLVIIPYFLAVFFVSQQLFNSAVIGLIITVIYLCVRYNTYGPVLKSASGGFTAVATVSILEVLFSRRNSEQGSYTLGAFVGAMIVILAILTWNTLKAMYYLVKETITFAQNYEHIKKVMTSTSIST